jgi:hypothetical protein
MDFVIATFSSSSSSNMKNILILAIAALASAHPSELKSAQFSGLPAHGQSWIANQPIRFTFLAKPEVAEKLQQNMNEIKISVDARDERSRELQPLDANTPIIQQLPSGEYVVQARVPNIDDKDDDYYIKVEIDIPGPWDPTIIKSQQFTIITEEDAKEKGLLVTTPSQNEPTKTSPQHDTQQPQYNDGHSPQASPSMPAAPMN